MVSNVSQLLLRSAGIHPDRPAIAHGSSVVRHYGELAERVASLAYSLRHRFGLRPGERVALFMSNCPQYVEVLFACWHAGLIAVPVNVKLHPKELDYILANSGSRLCFVTSDTNDLPSGIALDRIAVIDASSPSYEALFVNGTTEKPYDGSVDDVAWLFYTSGTTARPKGAMITHRNLFAMTFNYFTDLDSIAPTDSILHAAPMSHGSGLYIVPHVAQAALNITPESGAFDPDEVHEIFQVHHGVTVFAAPTMVRRMVEARRDGDSDGLKTLIYGGGPMYVEDCRRALARYGPKLAQIYGQGEAPMTITVLNKWQHDETVNPWYLERLGSVGHAFAGVQLVVAGADDQALGPGETGEVLVRGDVVMKGYWENPAGTAETLRGSWLHTGDVGCVDEEGFLTLKDRSKDVIISGGSNIYPREVEEVLMRHALVAEVAVIGVPDPEWGENVVALVATCCGAYVAESELDALCLDNIARFKRPKRYEFVTTLPKNANGKVIKAALREQLVCGTKCT